MIQPPTTALPLTWSWYPSVLIGLSFLALVYWLSVGPLRQRFQFGPPFAAWRKAAFTLGLLCVFFALISPLDELGDTALFSAHMVQHMLLTFAAPPLWLLGLSPEISDRLLSQPKVRRMWSLLTHPLNAFLIFNGCMWSWHFPAVYNAALANEGLHVVEHLSFMAAAVIGWWPVLGSDQLGKTKLSAPGKAFYLFLSTFPCTALAALITFSSHQLYTFYGSAPLQVGLTPLLDQQLGGVLMWLPGDMIFMLAILIIIGGWLFQPTQVKDLPKVEAKQEPRSAASFRRSTLKEAADRGL